MTVNISYKKLKGDVVENYKKTKKGWLNKDVEWNKLQNVLSNSKIQFSSYSYNHGIKLPQHWNNDNQDMLVFDIDDGISIAEAQKMFKKYKYLIGTTKSHQKDKKGVICDRFRLCLPAINIPTDKDVYFKMLNILVPFNDEQTEHSTGAFLGYDDAIIIYNDGKLIDCHNASILAEKQVVKEAVKKIEIDKDLMPDYNGLSFKDLKEQLTFESVVDIIESIGYEVIGNKFKLREEERTASCTIRYGSLNIVDYGGEFSGDIFQLLKEYNDMSFSEAKRYVRNFI